MHRPRTTLPALAVGVVLAGVIGAPAAYAGDQDIAGSAEPHDRICAQATFPDGTTSPLICIPNPL